MLADAPSPRGSDADLSIVGTLSERFRQVVAFPPELLEYSSWETRSGRDLFRRTVTSTAFQVTAPRITQQSRRPRVSDRTMVDIAYNQAGLPTSTIGRRRRHPEQRATEMEKENPRRLSRAHQKRGFHLDQGLEVTQLFSIFSRGTSIFLDIPLYRTGRDSLRSWLGLV
jgi:hypothetical protein